MKRLKVYLWLCSLFFITILFGCTEDIPSAPTSSPTTPFAIITDTEASATQTATPIPSATSTPTPSVTPTDIPALPAEDARQRLLTLLANNNDCRLPCLWGITPGKSNYLEARSILLPLRDIAWTAYFDPAFPQDRISPLYLEDNQRLYSEIDYWYGTDGIVNMLQFQVKEEGLYKKDENGNQILTNIFDSATFGKRVEYYSLSRVLSEQGMPDAVLIHASGLLVGGLMDIALLYPDQGIWVNYTTLVIYNNGIVKRGCPANAHVDMFLFPPGDSDSYFSLLDKTDWHYTKGGYVPLEEATSMTPEQFYETFSKPTSKCIETPANLWPTPEP